MCLLSKLTVENEMAAIKMYKPQAAFYPELLQCAWGREVISKALWLRWLFKDLFAISDA